MATSAGTITAHLKLDTSQFDRQMRKVKRRMFISRWNLVTLAASTSALAVSLYDLLAR